jgi:hypothetical protein
MKKIATHIATTSDSIESEKDKLTMMNKEIIVLQRKCIHSEIQIKQEISDKEIITKKLDSLTQIYQKTQKNKV